MITSFYSALLGLCLIVLSIQTILARRKFGVGLGDGKQLEMMRYTRAQANFAEYSPFFLILLGFSEINGLQLGMVNLFGLLFLVGRIMHAFSLLRHEQYDSQSKLIITPKWRIRGMICTFVSIGSLSIIILIQLAIGITKS